MNEDRPAWQGYAGACVGVFAAWLGTTVLLPWIVPSISLLFFPVIVVTGLYSGYGPALFSTVLSTLVLAYFFVPPVGTFDIGADDAIRLVTYASVALLTASIGLRRTRAEQALRQSIAEMEGMMETMTRIRDWPNALWSTTDDAARAVAQRAAEALNCGRVIIVWTAGNSHVSIAESAAAGDAALTSFAREAIEPIVTASLAAESFLAVAEPQDEGKVTVTTRNAAETWERAPVHPTLQRRVGAEPFGSAPFSADHVSGRVFFCSLQVRGVSALSRVELVAKEIGASLERAAMKQPRT